MISKKIKKHEYLWLGKEPGWVLVDLDENENYDIFNEIHNTFLHIEDSDLNLEICKKMKEAGVKVITKIEKKDITVEPLEED